MQTSNQNQADRDEIVSYRRRGIYYGLCALLPKKTALTAVKIWQSEFSDKPVYALQPFITRLGKEFDIDIPRNMIQRTLINALNMEVSQLPPDPLGNEDIDRPYLVASKETLRVFSHLLSAVISIADNHDTTSVLNIRNGFSESLKQLDTRPQLHDQLMLIFSEPGKDMLIGDLSVNQMQEILHLLYVQMCEYLGPINTDRIISEAISLTEALPESSICPPRSFL